jgi:hypothetical protein
LPEIFISAYELLWSNVNGIGFLGIKVRYLLLDDPSFVGKVARAAVASE